MHTASRCSTLSSRAAMLTSGMFEPCPLTIRMRRKPWRDQRAALVEQRLHEHVPAQRHRAREVHVVRGVAVDLGREEDRPRVAAPVEALRSRPSATASTSRTSVSIGRW